MRVCVTQSIESAHKLPGTEMHGHTYTVSVWLSGQVNTRGMVYPVDELKRQLAEILHRYDHGCLNDFAALAVPTAEHLALQIQKDFTSIGELGLTVGVRVQIGNGGYVETE